MKDKQKRSKLSILAQFAILFLAALIISTVAGLLIDGNFILKESVKHGGDIAKVVAVSAEIAIGSEEGLKALTQDEKFREKVHRSFRYICEQTEARYLYLYTIDGEMKRHYIICAAGDDEDDRRLNEELGFGYTSEKPLYDSEISILNGELDGAYEFVNNKYGNVCTFTNPVVVDGSIAALIGVDYDMEDILEIEHQNIAFLLVHMLLTMGFVYVITLLLLRRSVIRPILVLSEKMRNFVKNRGNTVKATVKTSLTENEITGIEESFDKMADDIAGYVGDIKVLAGEKAQRDAQLDIARKIQLGLVPQEYFLEGEGYEAYARENPAREVGGDFYDIFSPDEDHICMIVGDISGKGISAALFMIIIRMAITEKIKHGDALDETLNRVNNDICRSNPENMFATVFAMMLNRKTGDLTFANAGHEPPLLLGREGGFLKMKPGMALGLFEDADIVTEELRLDDGEGLLVYTDGVTEAINKDKAQYGREGLEKAVYSAYNDNGGSWRADKTVGSVIKALNEYTKDQQQFDDITCGALVYSKSDGKELSADIASFKAVKQEMVSSLGDTDESRQMILACEEIFVNIINYSWADDVTFSCSRMGQVYSVTFSDNGVPFDPVSAYIREKSFEELDTGGMGIKLARTYSKEMIYTRDNNRNILTLKFDIKG